MTLMPIMSPVQSVDLLGTWVNSGETQFPDWDFTSISFSAGDLLVAVVVGQNAASGPSGFTLLHNAGFSPRNIRVYTKVASGSETTFTNAGERTNVATAALRNSAPGVADSTDSTLDPPSVANARLDTVFAVLASDADGGATSPPSGYTSAGAEYATDAESFIALAYRSGAPENENPGAFSPANSITAAAATFSITGA